MKIKINSSLNTRFIKLFSHPFLIGIIVASLAVYFYLNRLVLSSALPAKDASYVQNFVQWFGVLYGLYLSILLQSAITGFEKYQDVVLGEGNAISILINRAQLLKTKSRKEFLETLLRYVNHVILNHGLDHKRLDSRTMGLSLLNKMKTLVNNTLQNSQDEKVYPFLVELDRVINLRTNRFSPLGIGIKKTLFILAIIFSLLGLIPFLTSLELDNILLGVVLLFSVTFVSVTLLTIINDLLNPSTGIWQVDFSFWNFLRNDIEELLSNINDT